VPLASRPRLLTKLGPAVTVAGHHTEAHGTAFTDSGDGRDCARATPRAADVRNR
jgi:hypothetical protein